VWDAGWHLIDATSSMIVSVHEGCELYAMHRSLLNRHVDSWEFLDVKYAAYGEDHGPNNNRKYEFRYPEPHTNNSAGDSSTGEGESSYGDKDDEEEDITRSRPHTFGSSRSAAEVKDGILNRFNIERVDLKNMLREMQV